MLSLHCSKQQTYHGLARLGVYWPEMKQDVNNYVNNCHQCMVKPPVEYATCYQVNITPKWSQYIIDYLTKRVFPEGMSRTRMRAIETEAREYSLIGNQLYKCCADNELRMCAIEA